MRSWSGPCRENNYASRVGLWTTTQLLSGSFRSPSVRDPCHKPVLEDVLSVRIARIYAERAARGVLRQLLFFFAVLTRLQEHFTGVDECSLR
jgi:hypothetical protein